MATLTPEQIAELRRIVADASTAAAVVTSGYEVTDDELQRLIDEGFIQPSQIENLVLDSYTFGQLMNQLPAAKGMLYDQFQRRMAANPIKLSSAEQRAYDFASARAGTYIVGLGNRYSQELGTTLIDADQVLAERLRVGVRTETARKMAERATVGELKTRLGRMTGDWARDWDRVAATESHNAHQEGFLSATVARHGDNALMAKIPEPDACEHCRRLYLGADGLPVVHAASWWQAQGTNAGLKAKDWKPVLGAMHPWCRCQLVRVPDGFAFNEDMELMPESEIEKAGVTEFATPSLEKAGPFIGPRGGKWADPQHTVPWKEPSQRTGVIKVDQAAVRSAVDEMIAKQKWHPRHEFLINADHYPESHSTIVSAKDAAGKPVEVRVIMRPHSGQKDPRGVSGTHHLYGRPGAASHIVHLEVRPKQWDRDDLGRQLRSVLAHELTHAADPSIPAGAKPYAPRHQKKLDATAYYNKPTEVTARLQQIFRELNTPAAAKEARKYAELWADEPGSERTSSYLVEHVMPWSETWKEIEGHLTPKNRKRVLRAAARLMERHVEQTSEPVEKAYKLHGRSKFQGFDISIENRKGSVRKWYDKATQTEGETKMFYPYGYIRMTEGKDGDHVDVFLGPDETAPNVHVVHQLKAPHFNRFDEDKCMLGWRSAKSAKRAYLQHYDQPDFFGGMTTMPLEVFRKKVYKLKRQMIKAAKKRAHSNGQLGLPLSGGTVQLTQGIDSLEVWQKAVAAAGIPLSSFGLVVAKARAGEVAAREQLDAVYAELQKANAFEVYPRKDLSTIGSMGMHSNPARTPGENVRPSHLTQPAIRDWPMDRDPKKRRRKRRKVVGEYQSADQVGDTPTYLVEPGRRFDVTGGFAPGNRMSGDRSLIQQYQGQERADDAKGNKEAITRQAEDRVSLRGSPVLNEPHKSGRSDQ